MARRRRRVSITLDDVDYAALLKFAEEAGGPDVAPRFRTATYAVWCLVFEALEDWGVPLAQREPHPDADQSVREALLEYLAEHDAARGA